MGKVAIVLTGGVDRGAYQAGSLKAIFEMLATERNDFIIVGTSIGALNGAIIADGISSGKAEQKSDDLLYLWKNEVKPYKLFGSKAFVLGPLLRLIKFFKRYRFIFFLSILSLLILNIILIISLFNKAISSNLHNLASIFIILEVLTILIMIFTFRSLFTKGYLISNRFIKKVLEKYIQNKGNRKIRLVITATNLNGLLVEKNLIYETRFIFNEINKEKIIQAALASSAFPIVFPSPRIKENTYIDGGLKNNTPLNYAIDEGADTIIIITHQPKKKPLKENFQGPIEKLLRISEILMYDSISNDIRRAKRINKWLENLNKFGNKRNIMNALNLNNKRKINIIEIHPEQELGGWFEAVFDKEKLKEYVQRGYHDTLKRKKEIMHAIKNI